MPIIPPSNDPREIDRRAREAFHSLSRDEVAQVVADMLAIGFTEDTIARATRLSREAVRQLVAERRRARG